MTGNRDYRWTGPALVLIGLFLMAGGALLAAEAPGTPPNQEADGAADLDAAGVPVGGESQAALPSGFFDFAVYKRQFKKVYSSAVEEMRRMKVFMSNAITVYVAAMLYRLRRSTHWLAINHLADILPEELDMMRNKALEGTRNLAEDTNPAKSDDADIDLAGIDAEAAVEIADEPVDPASEHPNESLSELHGVGGGARRLRRKRRDTSADVEPQEPPQALRELPKERLINTGDQEQLDPEPKTGEVSWIADNFKPGVGLDAPKRQVKVSWPDTYMQFKQQGPSKSWLQTGKDLLLSPIRWATGADSEPAAVLPDEVFVDLRETGCFSLPRDQGLCGACYAFAFTAIMEWLHCTRTGKFVAFSEQYLIDCGKKYFQDLDGCRGGGELGVSNFVENFGLERRSHYPYVAATEECPYDPGAELNSTGHVRVSLGGLFMVPDDEIHEYINNGPPMVALQLPIYQLIPFLLYGGGVHRLRCLIKYNPLVLNQHEMVIVGHGREDGLEYWLLRNSFGVGWGEGGYYKLAKGGNCIQFGLVGFPGTKDGKNIIAEFEQNQANDPTRVGRRYANKMQPIMTPGPESGAGDEEDSGIWAPPVIVETD